MHPVNSTSQEEARQKSRVHPQRRRLHSRRMLHTLGSLPSLFKPTSNPPIMGLPSLGNLRTTHSRPASPIFLTPISRISLGTKTCSSFNENSFENMCSFSSSGALRVTCGFLLQVDYHTCVLLHQLIGRGDAGGV